MLDEEDAAAAGFFFPAPVNHPQQEQAYAYAMRAFLFGAPQQNHHTTFFGRFAWVVLSTTTNAEDH